jgi:hypothetical protein
VQSAAQKHTTTIRTTAAAKINTQSTIHLKGDIQTKKNGEKRIKKNPPAKTTETNSETQQKTPFRQPASSENIEIDDVADSGKQNQEHTLSTVVITYL